MTRIVPPLPDRPQLSMRLINYAAERPDSWDRLTDLARLLDRGGVDRLVVSDHVVFGEDLEAYARPETGGSAGITQPTGPDGYWMEPLTVLAAVTSVTDRIRLGTYVILAALRRPMVLAKVSATLDALSKGRFELGAGIGWQREEYETAGLEFERRGRLLDQTLAVCQTLWTEERASFDDGELRFENIHNMPKPVHPGGVPVWLGGSASPRVADRIARFGCGWIPWGRDARDLASGITRMGELLERREGPSLAEIGVVGTVKLVTGDDGSLDVPATMASTGRLLELGVTDVRCNALLPDDLSEAEDQIGEIVAAFRRETGAPS